MPVLHLAESSPVRRKIRNWLSVWWVLLWLAFLVTPVASHIPKGGKDTAGALLLVAGGLVYLFATAFLMKRIWLGSPDRAAVSAVGGTGGAGTTVLMLAAAKLIGEDGFTLLPYAAVLFTLGLGLRVGGVIAMGLFASTYSLSHVLAGQPIDLGLFFAAIASALAAGLGVYSAERRRDAEAAQADAAALRVQEERNRMARDLHDILGHSLTVITMKAELAGKLVDVDPEKAKAQIGELESLARGALADVRTTVSGYREMSLAGELARARRAFEDAGIKATLPRQIDAVSPDLRDLFAWAVREATTNVIRHSGAHRVTITTGPTSLSIADDGHGAVDGMGDGNGIAGLRERAAAVGAVVTTRSDRGFTLEITALPQTSGVDSAAPGQNPTPERKA